MYGVGGDRAPNHQCPFCKGADHGKPKTAFMNEQESRFKRTRQYRRLLVHLLSICRTDPPKKTAMLRAKRENQDKGHAAPIRVILKSWG